MLQHFLDIDPADVDTDGIGDGVTGAAFTLLVNTMPDGLAHRISILNNTSNSHAGKTITIVGTDSDRRPQTETLTGPGVSASVESTKYFLGITSITPSATIGADTFDIGWVDEVISRSVFLNRWSDSNPLVQLKFTGTIEITVEVTASPRDHFALDSAFPPIWQPTGYNGLVNASSDNISPDNIEAGMTATRIKVNSYSSGAELQVNISETVL